MLYMMICNLKHYGGHVSVDLPAKISDKIGKFMQMATWLKQKYSWFGCLISRKLYNIGCSDLVSLFFIYSLTHRCVHNIVALILTPQWEHKDRWFGSDHITWKCCFNFEQCQFMIAYCSIYYGTMVTNTVLFNGIYSQAIGDMVKVWIEARSAVIFINYYTPVLLR